VNTPLTVARNNFVTRDRVGSGTVRLIDLWSEKGVKLCGYCWH